MGSLSHSIYTPFRVDTSRVMGRLSVKNLTTICLRHLARATYSPAGLKLFESAGLLTFEENFAHEANDL